MPLSFWLLMLVIIGAALAWMIPYYRLRRALAQPFPSEWRRILARNLPVYRHMPTDLQFQLQRRIKQFLHEKYFIACDGLEMTDEIRVTIAGSACLLLLNRQTGVYPGVRYILVYPQGFVVEADELEANGLVTARQRGLLGQAWSNGKVILSWADVVEGNRRFDDGANVALHEFAHQLDYEGGTGNGVPFLGHRARYQRWAEVLKVEFERLQQAAFQGDSTLLSHYGATEPAEFFAVVTEVFFEQPRQLAAQHPHLFQVLKTYYRVDPADWLS